MISPMRKPRRHLASSLDTRWIKWHKTCHINGDTGVVACARLQPPVAKSLPAGLDLDDISCFKKERKVAKDDSFSLDRAIYIIPRGHNMVAFKVQLLIQPGVEVRVWHNVEFICELPYLSKQRRRPIVFIDGPRLGGIILASR